MKPHLHLSFSDFRVKIEYRKGLFYCVLSSNQRISSLKLISIYANDLSNKNESSSLCKCSYHVINNERCPFLFSHEMSKNQCNANALPAIIFSKQNQTDTKPMMKFTKQIGSCNFFSFCFSFLRMQIYWSEIHLFVCFFRRANELTAGFC